MRCLSFAALLMLSACGQQEPDESDVGVGVVPDEVCGRVTFGPNALVACSLDGAPETENGDPNPAEWIAELTAPAVLEPGDVVDEPNIEMTDERRTVGCGCLSTNGAPTGVWTYQVGWADEADRAAFGALAELSEPTHTLFGSTRSCDAGASCGGDGRLEIGYVKSRFSRIVTYGPVVNWSAGLLNPQVRISNTCQAPSGMDSKYQTSTCSFALSEVAVCHSRCDPTFANEALEAAAAFEDIEGFASNDFGAPEWSNKFRFRESGPLISNDQSSVFLVAWDNVNPDLDGVRAGNRWNNAHEFGLVDVEYQLDEPTAWDWDNGYVFEISSFCSEADCWWKNPERPISTTKAAYLTLCQAATIADVERNFEDGDGDGVCDYWIKPDPPTDPGQPLDNCPGEENPHQEDFDEDRVGNLCDNCAGIYNPAQTDTFGVVGGTACVLADPSCVPDETGDRCGDVDGDEVLDYEDNCPVHDNPPGDCDFDPNTPDEQCDYDADGIGDACDDSDGDGVVDSEDTCRNLANPDAGQVDSDGDGVGDLCEPEFVFVSPIGDPTIEAEQSADNEFVFDANSPGVLVVPITVRVAWSEYSSELDRLVVQIDEVGDSDCSISELTDPEQWTAVGEGTWEFETQYICEGLPSRYDHFGLKNVSVQIHRAGSAQPIGTSATQQFEVFWPMLTDRALWVPRDVRRGRGWSRDDYARNHPGEWHHRAEDDPTPYGCRIGEGPYERTNFRARRPPNWLYYWTQAQLNQTGYIDDSKIVYVEPAQDCTPWAMGWGAEGHPDWPRNMFFITDETLVVVQRAIIPPHPGQPEYTFRGQTEFEVTHEIMYHEHQHRITDFHWTNAILERPREFESFFEVMDGSEWSQGGWRQPEIWPEDQPPPPVIGEPYNRWRDLNGNGVADPELVCDLNDDNNLSTVAEEEIDGFCGDVYLFQVDMNRDGVVGSYPDPNANAADWPDGFDWLIFENHPEILDADFDRLPDWLDIPHGFGMRSEEAYIRQKTSRELTNVVDWRVERAIDWSDVSANHRL